MKRLLTLIAFALIGLTANAQTLKTRTDGTFTQLDQRLAVGKSFLLPSGPDTTLNGGLTIPGQLFYRTTDSTVYVWKGDKWHKVGSESGGIIKVGNGLSLEADSVILGGFLHKENTDINMRSNDVKYLNFNLENDYGELGYATKALWLNISNLPQLSLTTVDESDPENQKSAAFIVDPTAFFGAAPPSVLRLNSKYPGPPRADLWLEKLTDTIGFSVVDTAATILKKVNGKYTSLYVGGSTGGLFIKDDISNKGLSYKKYLADWNTSNPLWVTPKRYVDSVAIASASAIDANVVHKTLNESISGIKTFTSTGAIGIPFGDESQKPSSPTTGMLRYNTDYFKPEIYNGYDWTAITTGENSSYIYNSEVSPSYYQPNTSIQIEGDIKLRKAGTATQTISLTNTTAVEVVSISQNPVDHKNLISSVALNGIEINSNITNGNIVLNGIVSTPKPVTAAQYKLSALNTPITSSTDAGTVGDIRITSNYIYVCIATNTWVRAALSTW